MTHPLSPAKRHMQRHTAASLQAATAAAQPDRQFANAHELQLLQLADHRRQLKGIQSIERKIELKATLLPLYDAWIDGSLQADHGAQDEVLATLLLWHIDCGSYPRALQIADYALRHNLVMPDRFERTLACVLAEEVADAQLKASDAGKQIDYPTVDRTVTITDSHDMPDEVRAKLLKARGVSLIGAGQLESALADLRRAHLLHEKCGVKKLIETTERALKKLTDPAPEAKAKPTAKPTAKPAAKADTPDTASPGPTAAAS